MTGEQTSLPLHIEIRLAEIEARHGKGAEGRYYDLVSGYLGLRTAVPLVGRVPLGDILAVAEDSIVDERAYPPAYPSAVPPHDRPWPWRRGTLAAQSLAGWLAPAEVSGLRAADRRTLRRLDGLVVTPPERWPSPDLPAVGSGHTHPMVRRWSWLALARFLEADPVWAGRLAAWRYPTEPMHSRPLAAWVAIRAGRRRRISPIGLLPVLRNPDRTVVRDGLFALIELEPRDDALGRPVLEALGRGVAIPECLRLLARGTERGWTVALRVLEPNASDAWRPRDAVEDRVAARLDAERAVLRAAALEALADAGRGGPRLSPPSGAGGERGPRQG